jgi:hypothetical protein
VTFQIMPQEFHVLADHYVIRTRVPQAELTDAMIQVRVRNANLTAGDRIVVQCMNHERDTLLYEAEFRVVSRVDGIRVQEINDRETRQVNDVAFLVARKGEWWASPAAATEPLMATSEIRWNPGKQAHEVVAPDGAVLAAFTKEQGGKEAAAAFIAGPTAVAA